MTKRTKKNSKPVLITARVEANTGDVAFCCGTNNHIFNIVRGHSTGVLDMFPDEFRALLPVGHRFMIMTDDVHYWYYIGDKR